MPRRHAQTDPKPDRKTPKKSKKQPTIPSQEIAEFCRGDVVAPRLGMVFKSFEEASEFFDRYARCVGFGTKTRRSHKNRRTFELTCWKAGKTEQMRHAHCPRPTLISGCPTMIKVRRNIADGLYNLIEVNLEHNHELYPLRLRFVRFKDQLNAGVKKHVECDDDRRNRSNVTHAEDEYTSSANEIQTLRLEKGDTTAIQRFLSHMQDKDSNFFYQMDLDEEGCLKNVFWADGRSRAAYHYYGDVVLLDSTCLIGRFDVPLASFTGVNNHGQPVLFGCCLLSNETTRTYVWLFKAWLSCMSGHKPKAIITDQSKAIAEAVSKVFPSTNYRQCLGHIMKRISEKLEGYVAYKEIKRALKKVVYGSLRVDEFENSWRELIWKYGLDGNEWFKMLYEDKNDWAPVFVKHSFWAGLSITQRGDSMHPFFGHLESKTSLKQFFEDYERVMDDKYENEALADFESFHKNPRLFSQLYMEEQFCSVFTIGMFEKYRDEVKALIYCHPSLVKADGPSLTFEVKERVRVKEGKVMEQKNFEVVYNTNEKEVQCLCRLFQYKGILCRHALSVYNHQDIDEIPPKYIHDRWKKDFKGVRGLRTCSSNDMVANGLMERHANLHNQCLRLVELGSVSDDTYEFALNIIKEAMDQLLVENFTCRGKKFKIVTCEAAMDHKISNTKANHADGSAENVNNEVHDPVHSSIKEHEEWKGPSMEVIEYIESTKSRKEQDKPSNWPKPDNAHLVPSVDYQRAFANPSWPHWGYQQMNQVQQSNLFYYNGAHIYHPHYGIFLHRSLLEQQRISNQPGNPWGSQQAPQVTSAMMNVQQAPQQEAHLGPKRKKKKRRKENEEKNQLERNREGLIRKELESPEEMREEPIQGDVEEPRVMPALETKKRVVEEQVEKGRAYPEAREAE